MAKQDTKMTKSKSADEIAQMLVNNFFLEDLAYMIAYHMDESTLKEILEDEGLDTSFFASTKKSKTPIKKGRDGIAMGRESLTLFKELIQSIKSEMGIDVGDDDGFDMLYQFYVNSVHYYNEMVGGEGERFYASTKKSKMKKSNALKFGYHKGFYDENTKELKATCIQRCTYEIRDDEGYVLLSGIKADDFEDAIDTFASEKDVGILWIDGESFNTYEASTKKSKTPIRKSAYTQSMKGRTVFFHGTEYRITDVDLVGSNTNQKGEYGGQYKVYLMDAKGKTYLVPILIPRGKEDKITSEDDWTEYIDIDWGDLAETSPEDWTVQSYYYEHYGIEPHFDITFDIDTIKRALNVPDEFIRSIRQISEDKIEVEFDDSDWYYEHIPDNALYQAGYYYEWYDSYILDIYPNDDSYRKSTKKSKQPSIDISFEASVNSLRKTNYAKCGNINTIVKERK